MKILRELCSVPTAPFAEQRVVGTSSSSSKPAGGCGCRRDSHGNLLIELPSRSKRAALGLRRTHGSPGLRRRPDARHANAPGPLPRLGAAGVLQGSKVRFFADDGGEVPGVVEDFTLGEERGVPAPVRIRVTARSRRARRACGTRASAARRARSSTAGSATTSPARRRADDARPALPQAAAGDRWPCC